jgi:tRNA-(ms[2]io[6]A)-hydroxylase
VQPALIPSSDAWVAAALADLPTLLVDHAHCERRAATTALRHAGRHADWPGLTSRLSRLAREELLHLERVAAELERRQIPLRQLPSAGYAAALMGAVRPASPPPPGPRSWLGDRTVDEMLVCALIEARSHERFVRLAAAVGDERLRRLYEDLLEAEERHGELYLELAAEAAGGEPPAARLAELSAHEALVVARPGQPIRMHSGGAP